MDSHLNKYGVSAQEALVKPALLGLTINLGLPLTVYLIASWLGANGSVTPIGDTPPVLHLAVFGGVAVMDTIVAFVLRRKLIEPPAIRSRETFQKDFNNFVFATSLILSVQTALISVLGFVFFYLTGALTETALFCVFSVVVWQVARPREGFVAAMLEKQVRFVDEGRFTHFRGFGNLPTETK